MLVKTTVAIVAMGEMGAGVAQALVESGARVITSLDGRSQASAGRAAKAGVEVADGDGALVAQADFVFSIVPPARAAELAERLLPQVRAAKRKPVFVECNAVAPATVKQIAAPFQVEGLPFVDAGIIGPPPASGRPAPRFYASGEAVSRLEELRKFGMDVRPLSSQIGDASALKMAYGGINKGLQALGAAMILGAVRNGVSQALWQEMQESQPAVLQLLTRALPNMYAKAYRWIGEMEEIAKFLQPETGGSEMLSGAAQLYQDIARDYAGGADKKRIALLTEFLEQSARQK
jgi:3-hydroxyisobutyrate dehydrogenase-like beta-hydroxyacid dehydrogenase